MVDLEQLLKFLRSSLRLLRPGCRGRWEASSCVHFNDLDEDLRVARRKGAVLGQAGQEAQQ